MQRLSPKVLLILALIFSLGASALIYNYLQSATGTVKVTGETVIVAIQDIPGMTTITASMVKPVTVPAEVVQSGSIRDLSGVVGSVTRIPIIAGDQITDRRLAVDGKMPGFVGSIPRDKRAITVAVSDITGVSGFVKAGDYVDLFVTFDKEAAGKNVTSLVLQNTLVLAANKNDTMEADRDKKNSEKMTAVTLAVAPDEALRLALVSETAKIHLALRPVHPLTLTAARNQITSADIVGYSPPQPAASPEPGAAKPAEGARPEATPSSGQGVEILRGTKSSRSQ